MRSGWALEVTQSLTTVYGAWLAAASRVSDWAPAIGAIGAGSFGWAPVAGLSADGAGAGAVRGRRVPAASERKGPGRDRGNRGVFGIANHNYWT